MNQEEAIGVLIQVANLAQSKGALTIKEAAIVAVAIEAVTPKQEVVTDNNEVKTEDNE